jgi:hypothetical protein
MGRSKKIQTCAPLPEREHSTEANTPVSERKLGHRIISESATGERKVLLFPRLERVASDLVLPRVSIEWTKRQLESLAEFAAREANQPTDALIRAMRG